MDLENYSSTTRLGIRKFINSVVRLTPRAIDLWWSRSRSEYAIMVRKQAVSELGLDYMVRLVQHCLGEGIDTLFSDPLA